MAEMVTAEVTKHREIVLSVLVNAIKYRWERIPALQKSIERFKEGTDVESQSDTAKLLEQLARHRDRLAEVQKALQWFISENEISIEGLPTELASDIPKVLQLGKNE